MKTLRFSLMSLFLSLPAFASDLPCRGGGCNEPLPPISPTPIPEPAPACGFCDGLFEGFLAAQPGPLALEIRGIDPSGQISVTGHWNAFTWYGQGVCQQVSPYQAMVVFQFPNTPVQRGMLNVGEDGSAELDGQVDGGDSFRLLRHAQ